MLIKARLTGIIVLATLIVSCRNHKEKVITSSDIFNYYVVNHKALYFNVPPGIVSLFLDESQPGNPELKEILKDVHHLSFLIINSKSSSNNECLHYKELNDKLDSINFSDIAQINNGREIIRVKVDKERRFFNELVVIVSNRDALYCISFKGKIPSKKVINLVKPENVVAVTNLNRFKH